MSEHDGEVIDRFYAGLASGDLTACLACLAPEALIWHCFDGLVLDAEGSLPGWQALIAGFPQRAFCDVRRSPIAGGYVQQHVMTAKTQAGDMVGWAICVVVKIKNGLITRIDEYIDRAGKFAVADLTKAVAPGL